MALTGEKRHHFMLLEYKNKLFNVNPAFQVILLEKLLLSLVVAKQKHFLKKIKINH